MRSFGKVSLSLGLGFLFLGKSEALPSLNPRGRIAQHLFGGGWVEDQLQWAFGTEAVDDAVVDVSDEYEKCQTLEVPGVGFELTSTYATAAIKYRNGTIVDVGRIDGDTDYVNTMFKLLVDVPAKPGKIRSKWQNLRRTLRKLIGLPATEDIGVLANMLSSLKLATEAKLGSPVTYALAALPVLPNLSEETLQEAFDYARIIKVWHPLYELGENLNSINAAYAGMGHGLCENWKDMWECRGEETSMDPQQTLVISFDDDSAIVTNAAMYSAYQSTRQSINGFPYIFEGYQDHDRGVLYWNGLENNIARMIEQVGERFPGNKIQKIVLTGEHAAEMEFLKVVWKVLHKEQEWLDGRAADIYAQLQVPGFDALYVGARGAAELAMRWRGDVEECVAETSPAVLPVDASNTPAPAPNMPEVCIATGKGMFGDWAVEILSEEELESFGLLEFVPGIWDTLLPNIQKQAGDLPWMIIAKEGPVPQLLEFDGIVLDPEADDYKEPKLGKIPVPKMEEVDDQPLDLEEAVEAIQAAAKAYLEGLDPKELWIALTVATGQSKTDGGKVDIVTKEWLEAWDLGMDSARLQQTVKDAQEGAGDRAWKVDIKKFLTIEGLEVSVTIYEPTEKREELRLGRVRRSSEYDN